jgi:hypothetical protein
MGIRNLAEAIILQSIEDLSIDGQREDCMRFFNGQGFNICAGIAGINSADQEKLFDLVNGLIKPRKSGYEKFAKGK